MATNGPPYHHYTSSFEGIREEGEALRKMIVDEIYNVTATKTTWLAGEGQTQCNDLAKTSRVKRLSIFFQLEYWKVNFHILIHVCPNLKID
jgi:hypothetical protein